MREAERRADRVAEEGDLARRQRIAIGQMRVLLARRVPAEPSSLVIVSTTRQRIPQHRDVVVPEAVETALVVLRTDVHQKMLIHEPAVVEGREEQPLLSDFVSPPCDVLQESDLKK